jgi:hypothetical protein
MDQIKAKQLLYKSTNHVLKKIVLKNFKSYEIIENETRLIIDLNIIYFELKNSLGKIIDNIADRFKIIDKDALTKNLVIHIYSSNIRECILKINKILSNETTAKEETEVKQQVVKEEFVVKEESNEKEIKNYYVKYLTGEILKCIFTNDIINDIIYLSEATELNIISFIKKNWKIILIVLVVLILIVLIKKGYYKIFKK